MLHSSRSRPQYTASGVALEPINVHARAQVKQSALRQHLFQRVSAILDGCGVPATGDTLLRAEVHNQLRRLAEDFSGEPLAAVFIDHISTHYAERPGEHK